MRCGVPPMALPRLGAAGCLPTGCQPPGAALPAAPPAPQLSGTAPQVYSSSVAGVASAAGNLVAVVLWGAGLWWFVVALASAARVARDLPFNIGERWGRLGAVQQHGCLL